MRTCRLLATLLCVATGAAAGSAGATNSRPELEQVMRDLLAWLPGEYSSYPQLYLERELGAMPEGEHEDWYRIFARIEAPHIGPRVVYGELRAGGPEGPIVTGQQILYVVSLDEGHRAVGVSGRRIRDAGRFEAVHTRPELWSELAIDPRSGGSGCDFRWRRHGVQLRGMLDDDGRCEIVSKISGSRMSFDAEWVLNPEELWVFDNSYADGRRLLTGREDRTHTRFSKTRSFDCSAVYARGGRLASRVFLLHDRGGRGWIWQDAKSGAGEQVELFRGLAPGGEPPLLRPQFWLALYRGRAAEPVARTLVAGSTDRIALEHGDTQVTCRLATPRAPGAAAAGGALGGALHRSGD